MFNQGNICVSIGTCSFEQCLEWVKRYPLVELRMDLLSFTAEQYAELFETAHRTIATFRRENGNFDKQLKAYSLAIEFGASMLDLEIQNDLLVYEQLKPINKKVQLIASYHNFEHTPEWEELTAIVVSMEGWKPMYKKLVTSTLSDLDVQNLIQLQKRFQNMIAFSMGNIANYTRLLAPVFGAPFTYAFPDEGSSVAPGQMTYTKIINAYRFLKLLDS